MTNEEYIELPVDVIQVTDLALFVTDHSKAVWIPKSQMDPEEDIPEPGEGKTIFLKEWIALNKGLI